MLLLTIYLLSFCAFDSFALSINGNNENGADDDIAFGLSLLEVMELHNGGIHASSNLIIGPNGLRNVLAMLRAGAKGATKKQIDSVIG